MFESTLRDTKDHCPSTARTESKTDHNFEIGFFLVQKNFSWFPRECSMIFNCHDCFITLQSCTNIYSHPNDGPVFSQYERNFSRTSSGPFSYLHKNTYTKKSVTLHYVYMFIVPQIKLKFTFLCLLQHSKSTSVQSQESTERARNLSQWHPLLLHITIPSNWTKNYCHQWIPFEIRLEWRTCCCAILQRTSLRQYAFPKKRHC